MSPVLPREGSIMYLPSLEEISFPLGGGSGLPEPKAFDHPVVVLALDAAMHQASILVITSFKGMKLEGKHRKRRVRERYLPLPPADKHPDSGRILEFEQDMELKKPSWVKTHPYYTVPASVLRNLREGRTFILTRASQHLLLAASGLRSKSTDKHGRSNILASSSQSTIFQGYGAMHMSGQSPTFHQQGYHGIMRLTPVLTARQQVVQNDTQRLPPPVSLQERDQSVSDFSSGPTPKCLYSTLLLVGVIICIFFLTIPG